MPPAGCTASKFTNGAGLVEHINQKGLALAAHLKAKLQMDVLGIGFMFKFFGTHRWLLGRGSWAVRALLSKSSIGRQHTGSWTVYRAAACRALPPPLQVSVLPMWLICIVTGEPLPGSIWRWEIDSYRTLTTWSNARQWIHLLKDKVRCHPACTVW